MRIVFGNVLRICDVKWVLYMVIIILYWFVVVLRRLKNLVNMSDWGVKDD